MVKSFGEIEAVKTILVTRLDALGDLVLGTMLLSGLHARWPAAIIRLLIRPQLAGVEAILPDWVKTTVLSFDPRVAGAETDPATPSALRAAAAENQADLIICGEYNRIWASELVAELAAKESGASYCIAFDGPRGLNFRHAELRAALDLPPAPEFWAAVVTADAESRESDKYRAMLSALGIDPAGHLPGICIRDEDRRAAEQLWANTGLEPTNTVACFPGSGEGLTRTMDAAVWRRWIGRLRLSRSVVLLGSAHDQPVLDAVLDQQGKFGPPLEIPTLKIPADKPGVTAAVLDRIGAYVGMDTGPMHMAAVLGRPTLAVFGGGHRAHRFLPIGAKAAIVRMRIGCYGCDWLCPFDQRLCIKSIPEWPLSEAGDSFINNPPTNADPCSPRIYDLAAPADLPAVLLGPAMRQHLRFLKLNHELTEHHAYLAGINAATAHRLQAVESVMSQVAAESHARNEENVQFAKTLAEMTLQNQARNEAIDHINKTLTEMTLQGQARAGDITQINQALAEMTLQNQARSSDINHINQALAEMTVQNNARDGAIQRLTARFAGPVGLWMARLGVK